MIGRSGERGSGISMLAARHDDDDEELNPLIASLSLRIRVSAFVVVFGLLRVGFRAYQPLLVI